MRFFAALAIIVLTAGTGAAEHSWDNNIAVNEHNMTWSYTEIFTGADSIAYRISIDRELGDNDSFISAWELPRADKETRKNLRSAIDREPDVRINNEASGVEVLDVDSVLSPEIIGKTNSTDTIVNRYTVTYGFKDTVLNASNVWFLGQAKTPVTVVLPAGVDITNISGMDNVTRNTTDHTEVSGVFKEVSKERGELTLSLAKNNSFRVPEMNVSSTALPAMNAAEPMAEVLSKVRDASILIAGLVIILLVYIFKVRRN